MLNSKNIEMLVNAAILNTYDISSIENLIDQKALKEYIKNEINDVLMLNQNETLERRLNYFNFDAVVISDYRQKWIEIDKAKYILAGIRHLGGNPEKPFVFVWPGFELKNENLKQIKAHVKKSFKMFQPTHLNLWLNPKLLKQFEGYEIVQQSYVKKMTASRVKDFILASIETSDYYSWYEKTYKTFHETHPEKVDRIPMNDKELMENCRNHGYLYYGIFEQEPIGLIAAENDMLFGLKSVYMNEIVIDASYRGRGFSVMMWESFMHKHDENDIIWCNIDSENIPSTKAALKAGLEVFSAECFIEL